MRVALFAEGSTGIFNRQGEDVFVELWRSALVKVLGLRPIDLVFGISKKHIIALDPSKPKMSGASEGLDAMMVRLLKSHSFDAAIVAWDLQPVWATVAPKPCRWNETVEFYRLMGSSTQLPSAWTSWSNAKWQELSSRASPSARLAPPRLSKHGIYAVCMEPVFESLLLSSEQGVRRALGVEGLNVPAWPSPWNPDQMAHPDTRLLQPAILAAKSMVPKRSHAHVVSGDLRTAKHAWARRLLDELAAEKKTRTLLQTHPMAVRLREVLPMHKAPKKADPR
jgi:hypothetical protein